MPRLFPPTQFPPPHPSDPEPVGWALCTAAALWKAGRYSDAVGWIEKAATNATTIRGAEARSDPRVVELTIAATELAHYVKKWAAGDDDADPASIPVSTEFQQIDLDIESVNDPTPPMTPAPAPPPPERPKPPPRKRADTLQQETREVPLPRNIPVAPHPAPVVRAKRAFGKTLPEAAVPDIVRQYAPPAAAPPSTPLNLDFEGSILGNVPPDRVTLEPPERTPAPNTEPSSQALTVMAPDVVSDEAVATQLEGAPEHPTKR